MFNSRNKFLVAIVLISTLAVATVAQEPDIDYIREQVDKQFEQMRSSARRAYLGLMSYPQDVREAMHITPGQKFCVFACDDRIELVPVREMSEMRGFLKGIDPTVPRNGD